MSAKPVKPESKKTNQNVSSVEEQKPESEKPKEPSIRDLIANVDQSKIAVAEKMGIPLGQLINYMAYQEDKLNFVMQNMPTSEKIKGAMSEWAEEAQKQQAAMYQKAMAANPGAAGGGGGMLGQGGLMQLLPLLGQFVGSGGGNDALNSLAMEALKSQISMSQSITNAIVTKIAGKATSDVAESITS